MKAPFPSPTGEPRSLWFEDQRNRVCALDQRFLPHRLVVERIATVEAMARAIREMHLRGAPLIGVAAGYGVVLACLPAARRPGKASPLPPPCPAPTPARTHEPWKRAAAVDRAVREAAELLKGTRPTAVNLAWAVDRVVSAVRAACLPEEKLSRALAEARKIEELEIESCRRIGERGLALIEEIFRRKQATVNILTHCNAGWLACVRHGTATAPIYAALRRGIPLHVWVDETRPRNQGARLTAWELAQAQVPHTDVVDNTGGHLMQRGLVDLVLVGSDRATRRGDVANKIGTYLKALAARDNEVPFYVALPSSSIDWTLADGLKEIPIEERSPEEVRRVEGLCGGRRFSVLITPPESPAANYGFDVTPARLVTGLITERGICPATEEGIRRLFGEPGL